jgi:hypothetical protein
MMTLAYSKSDVSSLLMMLVVIYDRNKFKIQATDITFKPWFTVKIHFWSIQLEIVRHLSDMLKLLECMSTVVHHTIKIMKGVCKLTKAQIKGYELVQGGHRYWAIPWVSVPRWSQLAQWVRTSGQYYKHVMLVNDDSSIVNKWSFKLIDDASRHLQS